MRPKTRAGARLLTCCLAAAAQADAAGQAAIDARWSAPATSQLSARPSAPAPEPVYATVTEGAQAVAVSGSLCRPAGARHPPEGALVVVVRERECVRDPDTVARYVEVLLNGKPLLLERRHLELGPAAIKYLETATPDRYIANRGPWTVHSQWTTANQRYAAAKALEAAAKHGIILLGSEVVARGFQRTGFAAEVYNPGRKTIKHVTFEVVGYDAVHHAVRDRRGHSATVSLRGAGPIEPGNAARYTDESMWLTDVVDRHRITAIEVEFLDGTTKSITRIDEMRIGRKEYALLKADLD